jgi:SAM-dependent methyltransferase
VLARVRNSKPARAFKRPAIAALRPINGAVRRLASGTHGLQHHFEWGVPPPPEWYDHYLDVLWQWPRRGSSFFLERGVYGSLAIQPGATVLELCCGDGFNARHFYAGRADRVVAVDFDPTAISFAKRHNPHPRVEYICADIRTEMPSGRFANVMFDAAIEHFTETEIDAVLETINERLEDDGVLSGYTLIAAEAGRKHLPHHEREFVNKDDLMAFLSRHFPQACVFETVHPERTNLYFYASRTSGRLPFSGGNAAFVWHPSAAEARTLTSS